MLVEYNDKIIDVGRQSNRRWQPTYKLGMFINEPDGLHLGIDMYAHVRCGQIIFIGKKSKLVGALYSNTILSNVWFIGVLHPDNAIYKLDP